MTGPLPDRPTLVFIVGPGAVGKMTFGAALAARTGGRPEARQSYGLWGGC